MKKQKMSIASLKVKSFVTSFETSKGETMHVVGGQDKMSKEPFDQAMYSPGTDMDCQPQHPFTLFDWC